MPKFPTKKGAKNMWREIALEKLQNKSGTISFKTQREINEAQKRKLEQFNQSLVELNEINIKFHEVAATTRTNIRE